MEILNEVQCIAISLPQREAQIDRNYLPVKRILDVVLGSMLLIVVSPILLFFCLAVMLETPGLPFFSQRRVGAGGKPFDIYKIRTMYAGTDHVSCVTGAEDPRVTRLGQFLRVSKLDELPQLINIIRGEMSVIGPRPLSEAECEHLVNHEGFHLDMPGFVPQERPGLIGLEQVNRQRRRTYEERFELNAQYEANISWVMDFDILVRAIVQCRIVVYAAIVAFSGESIVLSLFG
jgi:lipopolysaccharide/colanic/teichoic acid biosynthesis glycosyltransferase